LDYYLEGALRVAEVEEWRQFALVFELEKLGVPETSKEYHSFQETTTTPSSWAPLAVAVVVAASVAELQEVPRLDCLCNELERTARRNRYNAKNRFFVETF
jgi:hypothetical protein